MPSNPYYDLFVRQGYTSPVENMRWRAEMARAALKDIDLQQMLTQAAFDDYLFFINAFCWLREPRGIITTIPFVSWPLQNPYFHAMHEQIEISRNTQRPTPLTVRKSRGQGGTWGYVCYDVWRWLRDPGYSVGYVTRNEDLVDSGTDEDTILWKVAWEIRQLPYWMVPKNYNEKKCRSLTDHTISNPENGSYFSGYAAGQDVARGGRKTVFRCDEIGAEDFISGGKDEKVMASISHVTYCMCLVSTYGGEQGVFYESAEDPDNDYLVTLDWRQNPEHARYSYIMREGIVAAIDPADQAYVNQYVKDNASQLKKLERRGHKMEGHIRSPWYDACCLLPGATPRSIARELDLNPRGAVGKVFDLDVIDRMKKDCCKNPVWRGKPVFDYETLELKGLIQQENGPLKLWFKPGIDNAAPKGRYAIGCDISAGGTGNYSSNSVACGVDLLTGEQILEWAAKGWTATKFARLAVGISKWMNNAYLGWESSGSVGTQFGEIAYDECDYRNVYFRDVAEIGSRSKSRKIGWNNGSDTDKGRLFEELCIAFEEGGFVPRSDDLLRECMEYEWHGGKIIHRPSKAAGELERAHGDRCIAAGVARLLCKDRPLSRLDNNRDASDNPEYGSWEWRHRREEQDQRQWTDNLPLATIDDILRS